MTHTPDAAAATARANVLLQTQVESQMGKLVLDLLKSNATIEELNTRLAASASRIAELEAQLAQRDADASLPSDGASAERKPLGLN